MTAPHPSHLPLHLSGEFEEIHYLADSASGLRAVVVVHDASLGPALGGIRRARYPDEAAALREAMDLARGMTLKCLLAGLPAGGSKTVMLDHDAVDRAAAYAALGHFFERQQGRIFTAADLGTRDADMRALSRVTRYVATNEHGVQEDLAGCTAEGVFLAAGTAMELLGIDEWKGLKIAIQGLGAIGIKLAMMARRAGARVFASDVDAERGGRAADTMAITLVDPDRIFDVECDVFAPCAGGGILDETTIPRLKCRVVCGAANQQLRAPECGDLLLQRNILYAPDLIVNAGAVIKGCGPALPGFAVPADLTGIGRRLRELYTESLKTRIAPFRIALDRAERMLLAAREKRARAESAAR